ncbi:MAG TPA: hypothetical protein VJ673_13655 [Aromatoleum sp.]|uniref:hypothetical protein n=1 Tax=Aromatoleum sp. TaxID=2307007 RepID=UPI002B4A060A|nr:hypothetical protein [Aromatoleum sp.]HJV26728.1 hypothetical protein [Aromatoleum sp.]
MTTVAKIYFTDFFDVPPQVLEDYGALNISLINDLPLFIDPFLLFDSDEPEHKRLHEEIIRYVKFLRDVSSDDSISKGLLDSWFAFPEVSQNWLGFSKTGNKGSGLGKQFAGVLHRNLHQVFKDFGSETITRGSHLEKLCLLADKVGRDHLSDFTTNLIKRYLLDYTQTFAQTQIAPQFRRQFAVDKVTFDYEARRWKGGRYHLPVFGNDYVLLTPKALLTKDEAWINRSDLLDNFQGIYQSMPDEQLRAQVNEYFLRRLSEDADDEEVREAAATTIEQYPQVLDYYIRHKEDTGEEAHKVSSSRVRDTEQQFIHQIRALVDEKLVGSAFYQEAADSFEESLRRLHYLKSVIEDQDGYRIFYHGGKPIHREADLQLMYKLTWCASVYDVNREVNNGRGPVDFKVSKGSRDKTLIEFKLASNTKLKQNLKHQVGVYEAANDTAKSIKAILYFSLSEFRKVQDILSELGLAGRRDVVLIDACPTNKPSASNVRDPQQGTLALSEED